MCHICNHNNKKGAIMSITSVVLTKEQKSIIAEALKQIAIKKRHSETISQ